MDHLTMMWCSLWSLKHTSHTHVSIWIQVFIMWLRDKNKQKILYMLSESTIFLGKSAGLLCLSCHNNISQSEKCIVSRFWWLEVQDQVTSRFMPPLKVLEKYLSQTSVKFLSGGSLAYSCKASHGLPVCVRICGQISPFYKDAQSYWNRVHPKDLC